MKIFDFKFKNIPLAIIGVLIIATATVGFLSSLLFDSHILGMGKIGHIVLGAIGYAIAGISTGNKKFTLEVIAIINIILTVLLIKVTILEAYIVPTGSMENTIMTGDFLIGSRYVYGIRTPDWLGIPYTDIGIFIPYYKLPEFKIPKKGDVLIFKYPRDKYVKYVKRCVGGPGDTVRIQEKKLYVNDTEVPMWKKGKFLSPSIDKKYKQPDIFLSSDVNINRDHLGPIYIPKKGDIFQIHDNTDWKYLLPILLMEGNVATLEDGNKTIHFTLQDPNEIYRRKGDEKIYEKYHPYGSLITPWNKSFNREHIQFLKINNIPANQMKEYEVTQNYYWAMGDNRDDSLDSRYWGFVPENFILGEALFSYFSIDLKTWSPRWDRIGKVIQ